MSVDRTRVNGAVWRANALAPLDRMGHLDADATRFAPDRIQSVAAGNFVGRVFAQLRPKAAHTGASTVKYRSRMR